MHTAKDAFPLGPHMDRSSSSLWPEPSASLPQTSLLTAISQEALPSPHHSISGSSDLSMDQSHLEGFRHRLLGPTPEVLSQYGWDEA